jgi:uncharacterized protein YecE (DUF72 family)
MDFGKLGDISKVDFSFQVEPPQNADILKKCATTPSKPIIYIGATGFSMKPWVGKWYSAGSKDKDHLRQYGLQFNTIEHNTTHYRIPDEATVVRWYEEVPSDFRYCPKLPQTISHAHNLALDSSQIALFCENIIGLKEKLGCCFLQLPPYFQPKQLLILENFLHNWPKSIPLAVEVRHEAFFEPTLEAEHFFQTLAHYNIATVITDVSGRRDVCHLRLSNHRVLVRFVGNDLHSTDYQRVDAWAAKFKTWFEAGLKEVYFFSHQPDNLLSPEMAIYAAAQFKKLIPTVQIRAPKEKVQIVQGSLF